MRGPGSEVGGREPVAERGGGVLAPTERLVYVCMYVCMYDSILCIFLYNEDPNFKKVCRQKQLDLSNIS